MFHDYESTHLSLRAHPIAFIRPYLDSLQASTARQLKSHSLNGQTRKVALGGVMLFRQRPNTSKGVVFITLEDETGMANLIIQPHIFEQYQRIILSSSCLYARGRLERVGEVVYILAHELESLDALVLEQREANFPGRSYSY